MPDKPSSSLAALEQAGTGDDAKSNAQAQAGRELVVPILFRNRRSAGQSVRRLQRWDCYGMSPILAVLAASVTKLFGLIRASRFAISACEAIARSRPR